MENHEFFGQITDLNASETAFGNELAGMHGMGVEASFLFPGAITKRILGARAEISK
jgi:hypothetical protein